jgi:ribosomal protein S24E
LEGIGRANRDKRPMSTLELGLMDQFNSDVLHPNRPNVSKDELRDKLASLYKAPKDSVSVFGFRTQFGGGKSTGFALIYDSEEALKKFEPHYRLVRYDLAKKIEKASRQQRKGDPLLAMSSIWQNSTLTYNLQASNARTVRRRCVVRPRPRVPRRRTNRRLHEHEGDQVVSGTNDELGVAGSAVLNHACVQIDILALADATTVIFARGGVWSKCMPFAALTIQFLGHCSPTKAIDST